MSKFDSVLKKISEAMPVTAAPGQPQQPVAGQAQPSKPAGSTSTQQNIDPKIIQELIAAKNEQQVQVALQKLQAVQQAQQKNTQQPAV